MNGGFVSGDWVTRAGEQNTFILAWTAFLEWSHNDCPGLRWAILLRDSENERHFISTTEWDSADHRDAWRGHPDFPAHLSLCRACCEEFRGVDYQLVASVRGEQLTAT